MKRCSVVVVALGLLGCGKKQVPPDFTGSYYRTEAVVIDVEITRARLFVTKGGLAVTAPQITQSMNVLGQPLASQSVSTIKTGAAFFESVKCDDESNCSFTTGDGCKGTLTRTSDAIVILASGPCVGWSGKWQRGEPPASKLLGNAPPTLPMPAFPKGDDAFEKSVSCHIDCGNQHMRCAFACTMGDMSCHQACNQATATCEGACPAG